MHNTIDLVFLSTPVSADDDPPVSSSDTDTRCVCLQVGQFKAMLGEVGVPAFAKWDKWLPKLAFDARFLLLPKDDRRAVFIEYVKSRVRL